MRRLKKFLKHPITQILSASLFFTFFPTPIFGRHDQSTYIALLTKLTYGAPTDIFTTAMTQHESSFIWKLLVPFAHLLTIPTTVECMYFIASLLLVTSVYFFQKSLRPSITVFSLAVILPIAIIRSTYLPQEILFAPRTLAFPLLYLASGLLISGKKDFLAGILAGISSLLHLMFGAYCIGLTLLFAVLSKRVPAIKGLCLGIIPTLLFLTTHKNTPLNLTFDPQFTHIANKLLPYGSFFFSPIFWLLIGATLFLILLEKRKTEPSPKPRNILIAILLLTVLTAIVTTWFQVVLVTQLQLVRGVFYLSVILLMIFLEKITLNKQLQKLTIPILTILLVTIVFNKDNYLYKETPETNSIENWVASHTTKNETFLLPVSYDPALEGFTHRTRRPVFLNNSYIWYSLIDYRVFQTVILPRLGFLTDTDPQNIDDFNFNSLEEQTLAHLSKTPPRTLLDSGIDYVIAPASENLPALPERILYQNKDYILYTTHGNQ